jgi:hypothetical protein
LTTDTSEQQPTILLFGHSHTHAVHLAVEKRLRKGRPSPVRVFRALVESEGKTTGTTRFEDFLALASQLGPSDVVLSMVGGNTHAVFGTIQHPQPFDFYPLAKEHSPSRTVEIIPRRAMEETFAAAVRKRDGAMLKVIRRATAARVAHLMAPPPKADNEFIVRHHETLFAQQQIARFGVSSPELRLKLWQLQTQILGAYCRKRGIEVLMPPGKTLENGFLRPEYYNNDATHGNRLYGEMLLRSLEKRFILKLIHSDASG